MIKKIRKDFEGNPDASLIQELKTGDRIAYTRLLGKYYDMVFLMLSALDETGEEEEIKRKASAILFSIWTDREHIPTDKPLKDYLLDFIYRQYKENDGKI